MNLYHFSALDKQTQVQIKYKHSAGYVFLHHYIVATATPSRIKELKGSVTNENKSHRLGICFIVWRRGADYTQRGLNDEPSLDSPVAAALNVVLHAAQYPSTYQC